MAGYRCENANTEIQDFTHTETRVTFYDSVSGQWFAVLQNDSPANNDYFIHKWTGTLAANTWSVDNSTAVETRGNGHVNCHWDDANRELHVVLPHYTSGATLYEKWTYNGTSWTRNHNDIDTGAGTGLAPAVAIVVDGDGDVWIAYDGGSAYQTRYSTNGTTWNAGPSFGDATNNPRIQLFQWVNGGAASIGAVYSDGATDPHVEFAYRADSATHATAWTTQGMGTIPSGVCDDHCDGMFTMPGSGTSVGLVAVKSDTNNEIYFNVRDAAGTWAGWTAFDSGTTYTRPKVVVNETGDKGWLIVPNGTGIAAVDKIIYREVTLSTQALGSITDLIDDGSPASGDFRDAAGPTHPVTATSEAIIVAANDNGLGAYFNQIDVTAAVTSTPKGVFGLPVHGPFKRAVY